MMALFRRLQDSNIGYWLTNYERYFFCHHYRHFAWYLFDDSRGRGPRKK